MLKNTLIGMMVLSSISMADEAVNDKNWFMEFGYQTSIERMKSGFESTYTDNSGSGLFREGLTDNLYLEIGKSFQLNDEYSLAPSIGFTQATLLGDDYHNDAITLELPLFYKTQLWNKQVLVGPSVKFVLYPAMYYNDNEGQVDMGSQSAFAYGIQSLWGSGDTKFSLGLENLTSANYSATQFNGTTKLDAYADMNGLYLNMGIHIGF
ncbi:hypothetical protein KKC13_04090 [bacterium]|nr:hypothetical protein [bacterium]MBU1959294.1 hypothetical protein [bacterium]